MESCSGAPAIAAFPKPSMASCSLEGQKPQEFQYLRKSPCCGENQTIKCQEQRGGSSFWGGFGDQLGWLCVILIIPELAMRGKKNIPANIFRISLSVVKPHYLG